MKKLAVSCWLLAVSVAMAAGVARAELVEFRDYDAKTGTFTNAVRECTLLTGETRTLADGWYAVQGKVTFPAETNLTVVGTAHLILCDEATLTITSQSDFLAAVDVSVREGVCHSLTLYGQAEGTGTLTASGGKCSVGIGGGRQCACGTVTINGGVVTATGDVEAAGIGGARLCAGGNVTINGGVVTAKGGEDGAGIGGGYYCAGDTVTINGGVVTATGGLSASAIGGGYNLNSSVGHFADASFAA